MINYKNLLYEDDTFEKCIGIRPHAREISLHPNTKIFSIPDNEMGFLEKINFNDNLEVIKSKFRKTLIKDIDLSNTKITNIQDNTFADCTLLVSVKFPETLSFLGDHAFYYCPVLKEINLEDTCLMNIEANCFENCYSLSCIEFPKTLKSISHGAFLKCAFKELNLENTNIERIDEDAFTKCEKLENVIFPESLKNIRSFAFADTALKNVVLPQYIEEFDARAFYHLDLESIYIPNSLFLKGSKTLNISNIFYLEHTKNIICSTASKRYLQGLGLAGLFNNTTITDTKDKIVEVFVDNNKTFKEINKIYKDLER